MHAIHLSSCTQKYSPHTCSCCGMAHMAVRIAVSFTASPVQAVYLVCFLFSSERTLLLALLVQLLLLQAGVLLLLLSLLLRISEDM